MNNLKLESIADVDQAAQDLALAWEQSFPPAPKFEGKKKNKLRNMVCLQAGYKNGYKTFLSQLEDASTKETPSIEPINARRLDLMGLPDVEIGDTCIDNSLFDEEKLEYKLADRKDLISDLYDWIGDAKESDRTLMINDVELLNKLEDEYVFSSLSTNYYVSPTKDTEEFNGICNDILEAQRDIDGTKSKLIIHATCNSDDGNVKIEFDATSFFQSELDNGGNNLKESLQCLETCNFGGDYATDTIAEHYSDSTTEELFSYLAIVNKQEVKCGFYCEVNKGDIVRWLKAYKPEYLQIIG